VVISIIPQYLSVPFRIDDLSVLLIIFTAIFGIAAHFLREIILGRRGQRWDMQFQKKERYDKIQIIVHWLFVFCLAVLFLTGLIIFKMDFFTDTFPQVGESGLRSWIAYHWYFSIIIIQLGITHVLYDTFVAKKTKESLITRTDIRNLGIITNNFYGLTKEYPKLDKLHPMQKIFHWSLFIVVFLLGFTGLTIWTPFYEFLNSSGMGYLQEWLYIYNSRYLHDILTFILVAILIGHFYFSTLVPTNWKVFRGMITGRIDSPNLEEKKK
jgi:cytochrome b subunit of formate dehydrogenase